MNNTFLYPASLKTKSGTKWGYINEKGEFVIQPDYNFALDFQKNGLATVENDGKYGCINEEGKVVIPLMFESIIDFHEGRAAVLVEGGFQVIDELGTFLTEKAYNFISMYQDGLAIVSDVDQEGNYQYGYLDKSGKIVIPIQFETASNFNEGLAIVKISENHFALIDRNGNQLYIYSIFFVGDLGDDLLPFRHSLHSNYGYINVYGNVVIQPRFSFAQTFSGGRAVVNLRDEVVNKYGVIDKKGSFVIEPIYNDITSLGENRYAIGIAIEKEKPYLGSKYSIANWKGERLTEFQFDHVSSYDTGIASVNDGKKAYFIDRSGLRARGLPVVKGADSVTLIGNLVRAMKETRIAYFDRKGNLVWKQNTIIPLTNRYRVVERKFEPQKNYLVFYPQVDGVKNEKAQITVNEKLKQLSNVKDIDPTAQLDYSYTGDFNVTFFEKNLLVLELYGYEYYFGAAHGMPSKIHVKLNMISGRFYELEDLFIESSNYETVLNEIIKDMIKTDPQYDYVFPGSFKGITKDQPFFVDDTHLYIYFPPYEIGPYTAGFPTFQIPFSTVNDVIDEKGEFWLSFQ